MNELILLTRLNGKRVLVNFRNVILAQSGQNNGTDFQFLDGKFLAIQESLDQIIDILNMFKGSK